MRKEASYDLPNHTAASAAHQYQRTESQRAQPVRRRRPAHPQHSPVAQEYCDRWQYAAPGASGNETHRSASGRHSYLNVFNRTPDEDGLIRESTLGINQFGAKVIAPEIFLANSYMTEDQYQYVQMADSQVLPNTFVRAQGSLIQDARKNFTESQNLDLLMPNSMDIDELRTYISSLF